MEQTLGTNQNQNNINSQKTTSAMNMPSQSIETESKLNKQLFKETRPETTGKSKQVGGNGSKVSANLDKWLKELKGHILSEFERTRANICHEHQKKLQDERDK